MKPPQFIEVGQTIVAVSAIASIEPNEIRLIGGVVIRIKPEQFQKLRQALAASDAFASLDSIR